MNKIYTITVVSGHPDPDPESLPEYDGHTHSGVMLFFQKWVKGQCRR